MTSTTTACARGCVLRGQHTTDCPDRDACRGCLPRPAEFGLLCPLDWQRLNGDVVDVALLVRHLRDEVADPNQAGGAPPPSSGTRVYRDPSEGSVLSDAIGAADELHATLADIAEHIIDEHPRAGLPDVADPTDRTGRRRVPHPNLLEPPPEAHVWRSRQTLVTRDGHTDVVHSRVIGVRDADATDALVAWTLPLLPWLAGREWVATACDDLAAIVAHTAHRWPLEEDARGRHVSAPCPRCAHLSLHLSPAVPARPTTVVTCTNPECAALLTEAEWDTTRELYEAATGVRC